MTGPQQRQQIIQSGANLPQIRLDMGERWRPQRQHDVIRSRRIRSPVRQLEPPRARDSIQKLLSASLLERHLPGTNRIEHRLIVIHAQHPQTTIRKAKRKGQTHPPKADHCYRSLSAHDAEFAMRPAAAPAPPQPALARSH